MNLNLFCIVLITLSTPIYAKETIHWAKYDFKPFHFLKGKEANTGMGDIVFKLLQSQLTEYNHENYTSAMPRILRDLNGTRLICAGMLKRKPPNHQMIFSIPVLQLPSHSLHFDKNRLSEIENLTGKSFNSPVSLEKLITLAADIKISITGHRSYGDSINQIIIENPDNFIINSNQVKFPDHIKLTKKKRVMFTIEYPLVAFYALKEIKNPTYHTTSIVESSEHILGLVACTNTPAGRKVIQAINKILKAQWLTKVYREIVEKWLPKTSLQQYRKQYSNIREQIE